MQVEMTEARRLWLERRSREMGYRKGRVWFSTCGVCGTARWASTEERDKYGHPHESLEVGEMVDPFTSSCGPCMFVQQRSPEVFYWVLGVVDWAQNKPKAPAESDKR